MSNLFFDFFDFFYLHLTALQSAFLISKKSIWPPCSLYCIQFSIDSLGILFLTFVYLDQKEGPTMADTIRKVWYFSTEVADKPGEGARILQDLKKAGVNLLAFSGFPRRRRVQLDFVLEETQLFRKALSRAKLKIKPKKSGFLVQGNDRTGAVAEVVQKLSDANINITAMAAVSAGRGRYGAILWVKPSHVNKAAKVLKAL